MKTKATIRQALRMRGKLIKDYATHIRKTTETARKYIKYPSTMKAEEMNLTDRYLKIPQGTTFQIATGKLTSDDLIKLINQN
jgi:hypothetical protein